MAAGSMQLGDDVCDSFADARDFGEAAFFHQYMERDRKRGKTVGRAKG
jgi:hypothetical protein